MDRMCGCVSVLSRGVFEMLCSESSSVDIGYLINNKNKGDSQT